MNVKIGDYVRCEGGITGISEGVVQDVCSSIFYIIVEKCENICYIGDRWSFAINRIDKIFNHQERLNRKYGYEI